MRCQRGNLIKKSQRSSKKPAKGSILFPYGKICIFASLTEKSTHLVDLLADDSFLSAYSFENASGDVSVGMELSWEWK